ncbi:MAG: DUF6577 family protein [Bacteroidota bacterium]
MKSNQCSKRQLVNHFQQQSIITIGDFRNYFKKQQPTVKDNVIRGRIHDLKESGLIQSAGRGKYTFQPKEPYQPLLSEQLKKIAAIIQQYFEIDYCLSSTEWLGEFSLHQAFQHIILLEVEKEFLSDVFDLLRTEGEKEIYLNPNNHVFSLYVLSADAPIILKPLPSRAPFKAISAIKVSSLEKVLVDLFIDSQTFYAYQGQEMVYVFEKAIQLYQIDYTRLFSYAERRKKGAVLRQFLKRNIINCPKSLLND